MVKMLSSELILELVQKLSDLHIDDPEVDLIASGLESIVLLEVIAIIEKEYNYILNLDKLESKGFIINASNLTSSMEFKSA